MDFFCLRPNGIRVGYPTPKFMRTLSRSLRRAVKGRAILALTANPDYALRGVRPGARLAKVTRRLKTGRAFHIGLNYWYLAPNGTSTAVFKVRHKIIEEIGIADKSLIRDHKAQVAFLNSFSCPRTSPTSATIPRATSAQQARQRHDRTRAPAGRRRGCRRDRIAQQMGQ